jgi:hypothetical protein
MLFLLILPALMWMVVVAEIECDEKELRKINMIKTVLHDPRLLTHNDCHYFGASDDAREDVHYPNDQRLDHHVVCYDR